MLREPPLDAALPRNQGQPKLAPKHLSLSLSLSHTSHGCESGCGFDSNSSQASSLFFPLREALDAKLRALSTKCLAQSRVDQRKWPARPGRVFAGPREAKTCQGFLWPTVASGEAPTRRRGAPFVGGRTVIEKELPTRDPHLLQSDCVGPTLMAKGAGG